MDKNDWFFDEVGEDTSHKDDTPSGLNYVLSAMAIAAFASILVLLAFAYPVLALALMIMAMAGVVILT